ncbi:MAG TPA: peroxide stress protein YaaA [Mariprofundaceae bacterium]|nr:peroxide stress protein YaaA [Mariprofundaceae bacterium]
MLIVISPAKKMDMEAGRTVAGITQPELLDEAGMLAGIMRGKDSFELAELMGISMKLADMNAARFRAFSAPFTPDNARAALLAFRGDVYRGLDADSLDAESLAFAQRHLRILSGLYGVLRPLDLIQPYRLEMGTRLATERGRDLYAFWGDAITGALNRALAAQGDDVLVNLASNEYFAAIRPDGLAGRIVTPVFKEHKGGTYRIIGLFAKRARGLMTRFIIDGRLQDVEALKDFDAEGYAFSPSLSEGDTWVFTRSSGAS